MVVSERLLGAWKRCRHFAYKLHHTFLGFPETVRIPSVDRSGADAIHVIVIAIWFWITALIILWAAGVGRCKVRLLYACIRIRLHVVDPYPFRHMIYLPVGKFPANLLVCILKWYCFISYQFKSYPDFGWVGYYRILVITIEDWLFLFTHPYALVYKSSCLMMTSGSGFQSRGVTCTSGMS